MVRKLKFDIEKADLLDDNLNSQFATAKLLVFSSGKNRHGMICSEDLLKETASSIYEKPIIFEINNMVGDFGTHNENKTMNAGFIVPDSANFIRQDDGRLSLEVEGKIWKNYSGKFLDTFKQNNKTKSKLSVEMDLYEVNELPDGLVEMKSFEYSAACILGDLITEASPGANIQMLSFSCKDQAKCDLALKIEFSKYDNIDFKIPKNVKENIKIGLDLYAKYNRGGTSVSLANARHLHVNENVSPERIPGIAKFLTNRSKKNIAKKIPPTDDYIAYMLYGGDDGLKWANVLNDKMTESDNKRISYFEKITFPYNNRDDMNPALKGIDPPITVAQGNEIAKQADAVGTDDKKNGWAIAISSFKKNHIVKDGHWVKKEQMEEFSKDDLGTGSALKVNKSKDSLSTKSWGSVDKTALRNKILSASNYKSLVHDVYMIVESGWEDAPSSHLKYPVMCLEGDTLVYNKGGLSSALGYAKANGENAVASKVASIQNKLGVGDDNKSKKEDMGMTKEELEEAERLKKLQMADDHQEPDEDDKNDGKNDDDQDDDDADDKKDDKTDDKKDDKKDMSLDANLDVAAALKFLESETEDYQQLVNEFSDDGGKDFAKMSYALYAKAMSLQKMCDDMKQEMDMKVANMSADKEEMAAKMTQMEADNIALMAFKKDVEQKQFSFEVDSTLNSIQESVNIPKDELDRLKEESKNFDIKTIDGFKNLAKAKAFEFAKKDKNNKGDKTPKYGYPWGNKTQDQDESIWDRLKK